MDLLSSFNFRGLKYLFTDIDGTLTSHGRLPETTYAALWRLTRAGVNIVPVTGRPAGWCDMIARFWPVHGVIGENGGLYFRLTDGKMRRFYAQDRQQRRQNRVRLKAVARDIIKSVPTSQIAADQFCRQFDLAIDFAEDVSPLPEIQVKKIKSIFEKHGAQAKISNIHVNGWFGNFDKLQTCRLYCHNEFGFDLSENLDQCAFVGDSPNDEPMFSFFKWSFGVHNVSQFKNQMRNLPRFISNLDESDGFVEIVDRILTV